LLDLIRHDKRKRDAPKQGRDFERRAGFSDRNKERQEG